MVEVRVLTFCRGREFLYGNLLVFETLRVGFPTAKIEVWDNASEASCVEDIRKAAMAAGAASFNVLPERILHADWMDRMLAEAPDDRPLVFVDPDVIFWKSVEDWTFPEGTEIAGRYVPRIQFTKEAPTDARLHTSLFWILHPAKVRDLKAAPHLYDFHPFHGSIFRDTDGRFRHIDTAGNLYSVWKEYAHRFSEDELNAFDHIWCGGCLDYGDSIVVPEALTVIRDAHTTAKSHPSYLRGLWKTQEALFKRLAVPDVLAPVAPAMVKGYSRPSEAEMHLRWARDNKHAAELIGLFGRATQLADDMVDMDREWTKSERGRSYVMSELLYILLVRIPGNPFYRTNELFFPPLFVNCLVTWDASNEWAHAVKKETRMFAYVMREAAGRLVEAVAYLVGGMEWSRQVAREVHEYFHVLGGEAALVEPFEKWQSEVLA